jgi:hopanoid C-3 methylase
MKILLVQPGWGACQVGFNNLTLPEPLGLEILAATIPQHEVRILDTRLEPSVQEALANFQPDMVGVTGYTSDVPAAQQIVRTAKEWNSQVFTVVGGHHASLMPQDFDFPEVDAVVVGEGEITFAELVDAVAGGREWRDIDGIIYRQDDRQVFSRQRDLIRNLDETPMPARQLTAKYRKDYYFRFWQDAALIESARGCPYRCTFCSVWRFYQKKCRFKSPDRVAQEISSLSSEYICIVDDNFLQNLTRAQRIGELLESADVRKKYWIQARSDSIAKRPDIFAQWAKLGLSTVLIGLEAFRESDLEAINKSNSIATNEKAIEIMHENNVDIWGAFIVDPNWDEHDFDELIAYVRDHRVTFPQFTILTPLPGTDLFEQRFHDMITHNYERFDFLHTVLPTKLPLEEFYANVARLYGSTSLSLADIKRKIRDGNIPFNTMRRMKGMLDQLTDPKAYLGEGQAC